MATYGNSARLRDYSRLFKILARGAQISFESAGTVRLAADQHVYTMHKEELASIARKGLIRRNGNVITLTEAGENLVGGHAHSTIAVHWDATDGTLQASNEGESPLLHLRRHKSADGSPFLDEQQFEAGERLRSDFTRGQLTPRISANWQAAVYAGRRSGEAGGVENLTNSALAARHRFENAIKHMGTDLAGAVTDICCFLKGMEQVELERRWPRRSAKFMLRAGLTVLSQHYNPQGSTQKSHRWGADGYRPVIP